MSLVNRHLSLCHFVTLSLCHFVTLSLCHFVTLSLCHFVTLSLCHFVTVSLCHFATLPLCHFATLPLCHFVTSSVGGNALLPPPPRRPRPPHSTHSTTTYVRLARCCPSHRGHGSTPFRPGWHPRYTGRSKEGGCGWPTNTTQMSSHGLIKSRTHNLRHQHGSGERPRKPLLTSDLMTRPKTRPS